MGFAKAPGGIRRSSRVAISISSVLPGKREKGAVRGAGVPGAWRLSSPPQGAGNVVMFQAGASQPGTGTHHWLSCISSVFVSELCSSSPRLRTRYSRDRPNCGDTEGISHLHAFPGRMRESPTLPNPPEMLAQAGRSWLPLQEEEEDHKSLPAQEGLTGATFPPQIPGLEHGAQQDRARSCCQAEVEPRGTSYL